MYRHRLVEAVHQHGSDLLWQFLIGFVQTEVICLCQRFQKGVRKAPLLGGRLPSHDLNRPLVERQPLIRHHQVFVKLHLISQPRAFRAGAVRVVEGKTPGLNLRNGNPAIRAGKTLGKRELFSADDIHHQKA